MATIAIVSVETTDLALNETFDAVPEATFECERIIESGDDVVMPLLWARNVDRDPLEAALDADPTVDDLAMLAEFDDEYLYRMNWFDRIDLVLQMLTNSKATILDAYGSADGWQLRVMFPTREKFSKTHTFCEEHGVSFDVQSVREMDGQPAGRYGLTQGQYEALVEAARSGYYDVPQEKTLQELAADLDVSHQALSEQLRRGTESLIEDTLLVGTPPDFV